MLKHEERTITLGSVAVPRQGEAVYGASNYYAQRWKRKDGGGQKSEWLQGGES